jgi:hypothetical protein
MLGAHEHAPAWVNNFWYKKKIIKNVRSRIENILVRSRIENILFVKREKEKFFVSGDTWAGPAGPGHHTKAGHYPE